MATNETLIPIPGRLHAIADDGHVAGADEIFDDTLNKTQAQINADICTFPDQTGQSGKFLTTDGTDASWAEVNMSAKADKLPMTGEGAATENNFMAIDANGNIKDSGKNQNSFQAPLTFDTIPTANSTNPVTSAGIKAYVDQYPSLDIPIPFEDDDVKALVAEKFGGVTGGLTQVPGVRGEVTFRQAMAVTDSMMYGVFQNATVAKPFNEFRFFRGLTDTGTLAFKDTLFTSLIIPEGVVTISHQSLRPNIPYVEFPSTVTSIGRYNFWYGASPSIIKIWATTPPSTDYSTNTWISKILVPQTALSAYQQHTEWSKYGDIFEGF